MGVGSALVAAVLHDRRAVGVDSNQEYVGIAESRILAAVAGTLKKRELGKPIYSPNGEKVAQRPLDWPALSDGASSSSRPNESVT